MTVCPDGACQHGKVHTHATKKPHPSLAERQGLRARVLRAANGEGCNRSASNGHTDVPRLAAALASHAAAAR
eukprot:7690402-Alexandrium_andersonii.AAC.1